MVKTLRCISIVFLLTLTLVLLTGCPPRKPVDVKTVMVLPFINGVDPQRTGPEQAMIFDALQMTLPMVDGVMPLDLAATLSKEIVQGRAAFDLNDPAGLVDMGRTAGVDFIIVGIYITDLNETNIKFLFIETGTGRQNRFKDAGFLENIHLICAKAALEFSRFSERDPSRELWELANTPDPQESSDFEFAALSDKLFEQGFDSELLTLCDSMLQDDPENLEALIRTVQVSIRYGDLEMAGQLLQYGFDIVKERNDRSGRIRLLNLGGIILTLSGDNEGAEMMLFTALDLATQNADVQMQGEILCNMADLYAGDGRLNKAGEISARAVRLLENSPYRNILGDGYLNVAAVAIDAGDTRKALQQLKSADRAYAEAGDHRSRALVAKIRGDLKQNEDHPAGAMLHYRNSRDLTLAFPNLLLLAHTYNDMGELLMWIKRPLEALFYLRAAEGLAAKMGLSELEQAAHQARIQAENELRSN